MAPKPKKNRFRVARPKAILGKNVWGGKYADAWFEKSFGCRLEIALSTKIIQNPPENRREIFENSLKAIRFPNGLGDTLWHGALPVHLPIQHIHVPAGGCAGGGPSAAPPPLARPRGRQRGWRQGTPPYTFPSSPRSCRQDASGQPFSCTSLSAAGAAAGMRAENPPACTSPSSTARSPADGRPASGAGSAPTFSSSSLLLTPRWRRQERSLRTLSTSPSNAPMRSLARAAGGDPGLASTPAARPRSRCRRCRRGTLSQHLPLQRAWAAAGVSAGWGPSPCASRSSTLASLPAGCGRDLLPNVQRMANDYQGATGS